MKKTFIFLLISAVYSISSAQQLTNSIVVGGVTPSSAKFRISVSGEAQINVEAAETDNFSNSIQGTPIEADSSNYFTVIIELNGLSADTKYYYRALINGEPADDEERYFFTFPAEGTSMNFSFAFGSCQQSGSFLPSDTDAGNVFREIINHDIRFFLQIGDWTYPDTTDLLPLSANFFAKDYSLVQKSYSAKFNKDYPMDSLLRRVPIDYVYDDHDYMNNNSSALTSAFYIPLRPSLLGDDFIALEFSNPEGARENSIKGYKENFPSYPLVNESRGIYHKFSFGNADFFALDLRAQRDGDLNPFYNTGVDDLWDFAPGEKHTILGRDDSPGEGENQLDWFLEELKNSTATWKFIMSSVPFNIGQRKVIQKGLELQDSLLSLPELPADVQGIFAAFEISDAWAGYPADADSILSFIKNNGIENVIIMSGDSHNSAMDDGTNAGLPEIMSGNLEITNSKTVSLIESFDIHIWNKGGQGITTDEFNNAFGKITVFGDDSVTLSLIDEFGTLFAEHTIINSSTNIKEDYASPSSFSLNQNYPNPFNPSTTIEFNLPKREFAKLEIINALGQKIKTLLSGETEAGKHRVIFDAKNLASGIYFYRLTAGTLSQVKKMILMK